MVRKKIESELVSTGAGVHKRLSARKKKPGSELIFLQIDFKIIFYVSKFYSKKGSVGWIVKKNR
jgi:hypothetical protein